MAILVTGAAGYIGTHVCLALSGAGEDVLGLDNFVNSKPESVRRVRELAGRDFPVLELDIRDRAGLKAMFAAHDIDAVIHCAGLKAPGESCLLPLKYYENNVGGTAVLLQEMDAAGVLRIVFSSSATVYGLKSGQPPYREDTETGHCSNPYGTTKFIIEGMLRDVCASNPAWSAVLLRYFNPVGADESGRIGEDPNGIPLNLMPFVAQVAVGRRSKLIVAGDDYPTPDGTCIRDYIHISDLVDGHLLAVRYAREHTGLEVFNLGTGRGSSVLEMVAAFSKAIGRDIPYEIGPRRPGDLPIAYADTSKAAALLGFRAKRDLDAMCADLWRWQSENPQGY